MAEFSTDLNLELDVAIEVLPQALADDRDRLARFQREAEEPFCLA